MQKAKKATKQPLRHVMPSKPRVKSTKKFPRYRNDSIA